MIKINQTNAATQCNHCHITELPTSWDVLVIYQDFQEEVEDVEGRIRDFFRGLFGRDKKPKEEYEELEEDEEDEDEDDFIEDEGVGGNPFVRDGKLYGQDYDKLKVSIFSLFHVFAIYSNFVYDLFEWLSWT